MVSSAPQYRNTRPLYYTDKGCDSTEIGSIVTSFKAIDDVYDNEYIPGNGLYKRYITQSGDAATEINPEYQYPGYLYCDGTEYNIGDFPALYRIIGNEYGGTSRPEISVTNGGSNYNSGTTITFANPPNYDANNPGDLKVISGQLVINTSGTVTGVTVTNLGYGYDPSNPPTWTLGGAGSGTGLALQFNFNSVGQLQAISPQNVLEYYGETDLGTFKVPDLKAKKIVGYGNVYGPGSPSAGLLTLGVGPDYIGGKWFFDKNSQGEYFSLGSLTTTGYTDVTDSASVSIIGQQTVEVEMVNRRLQDVPQHTHFVYHTTAGTDLQSLAGYSGDRYLAEYTDTNKSLFAFFPVGGVAFEHKHALLKQPLADPTVATYDIFDYVPGAQGTGSTKYGYENDNYYLASGSQGAGTYEIQTYIPPTVFKTLNSSSQIGGRTVFTGGVPIVEYTSVNNYNSPGNYSLTIPATWETMLIVCAGGGGAGASSNANGGSGSTSSVTIDNGSALAVSCGGGAGGNKNSTGGNGGAVTVSGTASGFATILQNKSEAGTNGTQGPFYIKDYPSNPNSAGEGGDVSGTLGTNDGTDGIHSYVSDVPAPFTSNNLTGSGSVNVTSAYKLTSISVTLAGAQGVSKGNGNGGNGTVGGSGGLGSTLVLSVNSPASGLAFSYVTGNTGSGKSGGSGAYGAQGGSGGNKNGNGQNGGGGGGATSIKNSSGTILAGAGGGGGGGGYDGGNSAAGFAGKSNNTPGWNSNSPLETTSNLFGGGGANGGNAGCNGGGGGGGGGGIATSSYTANGGGIGGGGGGPAGHGGGKGGGRGMTSFKTSLFTKTSHSTNNSGSGYVKYSYQEDRSYWGTGGGGGGSGGFIYMLIDKDEVGTTTGASITVGGGGSAPSGVTNPNNGFAQVAFGVVTGYEGGTSSVTVGDLIIAADEDSDIYTTGGGTGTAGFKLPTTQVPEVEFVGGGGGTGATATVSISGGCVAAITLGSGGNNYTAVPEVRIKHGAGTKAYATATVDQVTKTVTGVALSPAVVPAPYTHYVRMEGDVQERFLIIKEHDCSNCSRFTVKVARGNNINGGDRPEHGGDELKVYYNDDLTLNFSDFLGVLVPIPTSNEISSNYDGDGTGADATKWYWYSVDLPEDAQKANVRFKIVQSRNAGSTFDSPGDTDHYGICDFIYENKEVTELVFVPADGAIPKSADTLSYVVEGKEDSIYTTGATALDATFTLNSQNPLLPNAAIDPDFPVPLIEPYHLCKYLIKAF